MKTKAINAALLISLGMTSSTHPQEPSRDVGVLPFEGRYSIPSTLGVMDVSCILRSWRIKGVLTCATPSGGIRTCLWVENAWPVGIFEIVRQRGKTHYLELSGPFKGISAAPLPWALSSGHGPSGADGTAIQFAEARVYTFNPAFALAAGELPLAIPAGRFFSVNYLSELDAFGWRSPLLDALTAPETLAGRLLSCGAIPHPRYCAGSWGSYVPRVGFVNHPSPVVAAALQGLRAGRVASRPLARVVLDAYPHEPRTGHYLQMIAPVARPCVPIGQPLTRPIETGAGQRNGAYLFLHFGIFETCRGCLPVRLAGERAPF